jgi:hypothetical protein
MRSAWRAARACTSRRKARAIASTAAAMIMGIDKARHHELARSVDDLRAGVSRQVLAEPLDRLAGDQDVQLGRLMDVTLMVINPAAPDKNARNRSGAGHRTASPSSV